MWDSIVEFFKWALSLGKPDTLKELAHFGGHTWIAYVILFAIVFAETGLLVGFFLPGDSLLFALGMLCGADVFDFVMIGSVLTAAAIIGDAVNYGIGRMLGERYQKNGGMRFVKKSHVDAAEEFYHRHGGKAIVLCRFVPLVRTFTPFVAGIARMNWATFTFYNVFGAALWVWSILVAGYFLGSIAFIQTHFEKVLILIVVVSVLPAAIPILKAWLKRNDPKEAAVVQQTVAAKVEPPAGSP